MLFLGSSRPHYFSSSCMCQIFPWRAHLSQNTVLAALVYPRWATTEAKHHSRSKRGKALIWFKQTQLWGLDCSPRAQSMILTLNRFRNMSFQPLCVCARVVNCFHVFDRWLGVPRSEANILLNKQWGKRREEEWGVGENTGCHLYFYLCKHWIFFFFNIMHAADWELGGKWTFEASFMRSLQREDF